MKFIAFKASNRLIMNKFAFLKIKQFPNEKHRINKHT